MVSTGDTGKGQVAEPSHQSRARPEWKLGFNDLTSQVSLVKALNLCRSTFSPVLMKSLLITRAFLKANIPVFS